MPVWSFWKLFLLPLSKNTCTSTARRATSGDHCSCKQGVWQAPRICLSSRDEQRGGSLQLWKSPQVVPLRYSDLKVYSSPAEVELGALPAYTDSGPQLQYSEQHLHAVLAVFWHLSLAVQQPFDNTWTSTGGTDQWIIAQTAGCWDWYILKSAPLLALLRDIKITPGVKGGSQEAHPFNWKMLCEF